MSIVEAAKEFDAENPVVWELFQRFTLEAIRRGHRHYSADAVVHRIRWHTSIETTDPDFKIANAHVAYYARKFMAENPEHAGFFRTHHSQHDLTN